MVLNNPDSQLNREGHIPNDFWNPCSKTLHYQNKEMYARVTCVRDQQVKCSFMSFVVKCPFFCCGIMFIQIKMISVTHFSHFNGPFTLVILRNTANKTGQHTFVKCFAQFVWSTLAEPAGLHTNKPSVIFKHSTTLHTSHFSQQLWCSHLCMMSKSLRWRIKDFSQSLFISDFFNAKL